MSKNELQEQPEVKPSTAKLVFIVSQPRSGSTLLQTILEKHPQVAAPGETWLMLPLTHSLLATGRGIDAPYETEFADEAIGLFAQEHLPHGIQTIQGELGMAASRIYDLARRRARADVLVDKTPRYYRIIDDLLHWLPDCRVIALTRNPLAVLASIITTWSPRLYRYRADLLEAPEHLAKARHSNNPRILSIGYEDLVGSPESTLTSIQQFMGIDVVSKLFHYGTAKRRRYGDPVGIFNDTAAHQRSLNKWISLAGSSAANWRLLDDYRRLLGSELLEQLGYDSNELRESLATVRPRGTRIAPSLIANIDYGSAEPMKSLVSIQRFCADAVTRTRKAA